MSPAKVPHGESLHDDLGLLVEALGAATALPAEYFGMGDRGVIAPRRRADLVLVEGDPTVDLSTLARPLDVWKAGRAVAG
jgi:imidazolonepropionase-like amidohydrolase